jgi:transcriptional regulator with PAS, ATPase and Fis domain
LRVLQERVVTRIGDDGEVPGGPARDQRDASQLERLVADGRFREDLYYRLNGYTLSLPRLCERGDLRVLIERPVHTLAGKTGRPGREGRARPHDRRCARGARALRMARQHPAARTDAARAACAADARSPDRRRGPARDRALRVRIAGKQTRGEAPPRQSLADVELHAIRNALSATRATFPAVARALGISRSALYAKLERYGLRTRSTTG